MLDFVNRYILGIAVPVMLICAGIFYAVRLKCFHITKPVRIIKAMTAKQSKDGVSPFRAVTLALAGTLGVGNIVGVSAAIYMGGFGSIFWMWVSALCAMLLKYAEIVLAMRHRRYDANGMPHGAAMFYIRDFFSSHGLEKAGKITAAIFAVFCIMNALTMGSVIQVNAVAGAFEGVTGIPPLLTGGVLAFLSAIIITRGTEAMSRFTEKLVPLMSLGYILISVAVMIIKSDEIMPAFGGIFRDAFSGDAAVGGVSGFIMSRALRYGTMRGLISNEAGCGTAPTAHAASNSKSAAEQGFWGIFEVFVDTILLCTMTALVIIVSYPEVSANGDNFIMMTISAYSCVLGSAAAYFLCAAVLCFAFATVICWAHYGIESAKYFSDKKYMRTGFIILYVASVLYGAFAKQGIIWQAADLAIGVMTVINVAVICFMSGEVKRETEIYFGIGSGGGTKRRRGRF